MKRRNLTITGKTLRLGWFIAFLALLAPSLIQAAPRSSYSHDAGDLGLGLIFGEPTGLSGKYWIDNRQGVEATLSYSFNDFLTLSGDYLYHFPGLFGSKTTFVQQLKPYIGAGGVLFISTEGHRTDDKYFTDNGASVGLGFRIPIGVEWKPSAPTIGVFAEIVPGVGFIPSTFGFFQGGVGIRYYFG